MTTISMAGRTSGTQWLRLVRPAFVLIAVGSLLVAVLQTGAERLAEANARVEPADVATRLPTLPPVQVTAPSRG